MDSLKDIVRKTVNWYASGEINSRSFALSNEEEGVYAVNVVDYPIHRLPAAIVVMARIEGDKVIIEDDRTDRPLVDALVRAGVPREQIVLAYVENLAKPQQSE